MKQRRRIYYNAQQRAIIWDRYQQGDSLHDIAKFFDRFHSSIQGIIAKNYGIRPQEKVRSALCLTLQEREEISRGLSSKYSIRLIAKQLNRSPSTVSAISVLGFWVFRVVFTKWFEKSRTTFRNNMSVKMMFRR